MPISKAFCSAQLNLPNLRLPRYDVPNTTPVTTSHVLATPVTTNHVLAAFLTVFQPGKLVTQTADALTAAYNAFKPVVQDIYPKDPFANFTRSTNCKTCNKGRASSLLAILLRFLRQTLPRLRRVSFPRDGPAVRLLPA